MSSSLKLSTVAYALDNSSKMATLTMDGAGIFLRYIFVLVIDFVHPDVGYGSDLEWNMYIILLMYLIN